MAGYIPRWFTCQWAVTHPSSNWAQCRLTTCTLIEASSLTTTLHRQP